MGSTLLGTNISPPKLCLKMIFPFPRICYVVPWRVSELFLVSWLMLVYQRVYQIPNPEVLDRFGPPKTDRSKTLFTLGGLTGCRWVCYTMVIQPPWLNFWSPILEVTYITIKSGSHFHHNQKGHFWTPLAAFMFLERWKSPPIFNDFVESPQSCTKLGDSPSINSNINMYPIGSM